jgi:RimJ/RimL family protein N-acetyltransferase
MIRLETARLRLRVLQPEDVTASYIGWLNDPAINAFLETRFTVQSEEAVVSFVTEQSRNPDSFLFRIALAADDRHIGNIKLGPLNRHHASAQLSLLIGERDMHGKGYATEAITAVTDWGFESCGLKRIEAGCYQDNLGSLRAFLKAGYSVEGFRRSAVATLSGGRSGTFWFARLADDRTERLP